MPASNERYVTFTYRLDRELDERVRAVGQEQGITNKTQALNYLVREGIRAVELRASSDRVPVRSSMRPAREPRR